MSFTQHLRDPNTRFSKILELATRVRPLKPLAILAALLLALWYAAVSQGNSMAWMLFFLLVALVPVAILHGLQNVGGIDVHLFPVPPVFAGEPATLRSGLSSRAAMKFGLRFHWEFESMPMRGETEAFLSLLPRGGNEEVVSAITMPLRGRHRVKSVGIYSVFPLSLFRCLGRVPASGEIIVYPAPAGAQEIPGARIGVRLPGDLPGVGGRGDDFQGHRECRAGESQRHVDWKAVARGMPLMVKEFKGGDPSDDQMLDWDAVNEAGTEARLSQLALWILLCEKQGARYSLDLRNGVRLGPASGPEHRARCLTALADFQPA